MKPKKIILDTDLGGDCDDAGAIALLHVFKDNLEADIIAMTHTTSAPYGPACIDIINRYYDSPDIPVGAYAKTGFVVGESYNRFAEKMAKAFESSYTERAMVPDAKKVLRKALADLDKGETCRIIGIGQLNNLSDLLDSKGDEISPLTGYELVKEKVESVYLMAGMFSENGDPIYFENELYEIEYNISGDIGAARNFIHRCPVNIVFLDFFVGYRVKTFKPLLEMGNLLHPVTFAYYHFCNCARESWDPLTVYLAIRDKNDLFELSDRGIVTVSDRGETHFDPHDKGKHYYVKLKVDPAYAAQTIDRLIMGHPKNRRDN
jgi:inosine-uridine nucleoside N-ribohydrolase